MNPLIKQEDAPPRHTRARESTKSRFVFWCLVLSLVVWVISMSPLWKPLVLAGALAAALSGIHNRLARLFGRFRWLSAGIVTVVSALLLLGPIATIVIVAVSQADEAVAAATKLLREQSYHSWISQLPEVLQEPVETFAREHIPSSLENIPFLSLSQTVARHAFGSITVLGSLVTQFVLMVIALYFFLYDGPRLQRWLQATLPLSPARTAGIIDRFRATSRSIMGANILTALAQTVAATIGYYVAQIPHALLFGLLTFFASFVPGVGTAIVAFPLALGLAIAGHPYAALFLAVWSTVSVGMLDNVLRPWLAQGRDELHGALVFFSIIGSVAFFGAIGLVLGPLLLSIFITMLDLWKNQDRHGETNIIETPTG